MTYLLAILIVGINASPLILPQLDIWHVQGIWTQVCILVLFSATFFKSQNFIEPKNKELGLLHLWIGLQTAFICFIAQSKGKYDITHFLPYFNFLCLIILYRVIVQYLNRQSVEFCIVFIRYSMIATLFVSGLQFMGASQFFKMFPNMDGSHINNPIVGFIGNGAHLSGFMAMMIPVFLYFGKREDYLCLVLMAILLGLSGALTGDPSISGWLIAGFVVSYWMFHVKRISIWLIIGGLVSITGIVLFINPHNFFSFSGRTGFWSYYTPMIKHWFVTGAGLGTMNIVHKESAFPQVRHLHMEYLQFILEIGIIGVMLGINLIKKFWETEAKDNLAFTLKLIFLAFCLSACFNYPAHLWLPSLYAVIAYSFFMVLKRGESHAS